MNTLEFGKCLLGVLTNSQILRLRCAIALIQTKVVSASPSLLLNLIKIVLDVKLSTKHNVKEDIETLIIYLIGNRITQVVGSLC